MDGGLASQKEHGEGPQKLKYLQVATAGYSYNLLSRTNTDGDLLLVIYALYGIKRINLLAFRLLRRM